MNEVSCQYPLLLGTTRAESLLASLHELTLATGKPQHPIYCVEPGLDSLA